MTDDLISRKAVYEKVCEGCTRHGDKPGECFHDEPCERLIFEFTTAPAIEAEPVRRGRWEYYGNGTFSTYALCSMCGCGLASEDATNFDYCPYCGAKMDLEV